MLDIMKCMLYYPEAMNVIHRRYVLELTAALASYAIVLVGSIKLLGYCGKTVWRYPVALAPVLPALTIVFVFLRLFRGVDELEQRIHLEALAFAFAGSAVATFAYGFLENAGFPRLNWTFVWPVMCVFWIVGGAIARYRYR